ncbi:putative endo-polygalacturonase [Helianthus anomalus]
MCMNFPLIYITYTCKSCVIGYIIIIIITIYIYDLLIIYTFDCGCSIGSLGWEMNEPGVQNVTVKTTTFVGTTNGLRIKAWARSSNGFVNGVYFKGATMMNVKFPIIIDGNYCPNNNNCPNEASGVKISNVMYENVHGTSATRVAVKFDCSKGNPCSGIVLKDVDLKFGGQPANSSCLYAAGTASGLLQPTSCL